MLALAFNLQNRNVNLMPIPGRPVPQLSLGDAGGRICFVGGGRRAEDASEFPTTVDTGPANRYAAGTFEFIPLVKPAQPPTRSKSK